MKKLSRLTMLTVTLLASLANAQVPPPPMYYPPPPMDVPAPPMYAPAPDLLSALFGMLFQFSRGLAYPVPDGRGGWVPWTNSRVLPDGTLRPYDPAIDGLPPGFGPPPQYPAPWKGDAPPSQAPRYSGSPLPPPPRTGRSAAAPPKDDAPLKKSDCYDENWNFNGWNNPACKGPQ